VLYKITAKETKIPGNCCRGKRKFEQQNRVIWFLVPGGSVPGVGVKGCLFLVPGRREPGVGVKDSLFLFLDGYGNNGSRWSVI